MDLVIIGEALMPHMPKSSLHAIARYGTGVQIRQAYLQFYEMPINAAKACIRIIRGENWHDVARDYPEPKDKLRIMTPNATTKAKVCRYLKTSQRCTTQNGENGRISDGLLPQRFTPKSS